MESMISSARTRLNGAAWPVGHAARPVGVGFTPAVAIARPWNHGLVFDVKGDSLQCELGGGVLRGGVPGG